MTTAEVARALRALSSTYVERRARLSGRGAFDSAGKRAAYALYYAPRRFLMTAHVVRHLAPPPGRCGSIDLGCGTGAAGAAWACEAGAGLVGDRTRHASLGPRRGAGHLSRLPARRRGARAARPPTARGGAPGGPRDQRARTPGALILSYVANELSDEARTALLPQLVADAGGRDPACS